MLPALQFSTPLTTSYHGSYYLSISIIVSFLDHHYERSGTSSHIMFDENFTFASSAITTTSLNNTSAEISPYTSRCSSPKLGYSEPQHAPRRDSRFDIYLPPRHPSITALTAQLEHHALSESPRSESPFSMASPADSSDQDEGFYDGPDTPSTNYSDCADDFNPSLWDMNMSELSITSSPRPSLSLEAQATSSFTQRRRHRQALVRLQCMAKRAPDIAMLLEECHPSEMPWTGGKSRSNSSISLGTSSGRIEKERPTSIPSVRKPTRMRKRPTR